jgi:hypothetical protein
LGDGCLRVSALIKGICNDLVSLHFVAGCFSKMGDQTPPSGCDRTGKFRDKYERPTGRFFFGLNGRLLETYHESWLLRYYAFNSKLLNKYAGGGRFLPKKRLQTGLNIKRKFELRKTAYANCSAAKSKNKKACSVTSAGSGQ